MYIVIFRIIDSYSDSKLTQGYGNSFILTRTKIVNRFVNMAAEKKKKYYYYKKKEKKTEEVKKKK